MLQLLEKAIYKQTKKMFQASPYNAVTSKITCSSDSSVEVSKLKGIISKECPIAFRCLLRLVTKSFITTLRQRIMKGIEIILAVEVVKYTVEGRLESVESEVVELIMNCVRLWIRIDWVVEEIIFAVIL